MRVLAISSLLSLASTALAHGDVIPASIAAGGALETPTEVLLARVCVSEEDWNLDGCVAIWRTIENVRSDCQLGLEYECKEGRETFRSALMRMSKRVTGIRPPLNHRQEWVIGLNPESTKPAAWVECGASPCDGRWKLYESRNRRVFSLAKELLLRGAKNPCDGRPLAWGGEMDRDFMKNRNAQREAAGKAVLVEIRCSGTSNIFYGLGSDLEGPQKVANL